MDILTELGAGATCSVFAFSFLTNPSDLFSLPKNVRTCIVTRRNVNSSLSGGSVVLFILLFCSKCTHISYIVNMKTG